MLRTGSTYKELALILLLILGSVISSARIVWTISQTLSLRQHTGLFRSDVFSTKKAKQSITLEVATGDNQNEDVVKTTTVSLLQ